MVKTAKRSLMKPDLDKVFINQRKNTKLVVLVAAIGILVFLVATTVLTFKNRVFNSLFPKPASHAAANLNYPKIANINGLRNGINIDTYGRYGFILASNANPTTLTTATSVKAKYPNTKIVFYIDSISANYDQYNATNDTYNNGLAIYQGWWLTLAGTNLSSAVDSTTTTIPVNNTTVINNTLATNPDILVDGESMHVTAVNTTNNTLTVTRGYSSKAGSHSLGARVAPHVENLTYKDWLLNLTASCPTNSSSQKWSDYLVQYVNTQITSNGWDGVFYDNADPTMGYLNSSIRALVDTNNDNTSDGSTLLSDWAAGETKVFSSTRGANPSSILLGNGGYYPPDSSGNYYERFPVYTNWQHTTDQYLNANRTVLNPVSIINPDTNNTGTWDLKAMRYGLGTTLLGDGYFAYDYGPLSHGSTWWFDEYDNAAGSSLASAITSSATTIPLATGTGAKFKAGDVVFIPNDANGTSRPAGQGDDEQVLVGAVSGDNLTGLTRGYHSTVASSHIALDKVMTQTQITSGAGWLGQPLGPATPNITNSTLLEGSFETNPTLPDTVWKFSSTTPAVGTLTKDTTTTAINGTASAKIIVSTAEPANRWHIQLMQNGLIATAGQTYSLTFWAKSDTNRTIEVQLQQQGGTYITRATDQVNLTTKWQEYHLIYPATVDDLNLRAQFNLAASTGTVWIDNVSYQQGDINLWQRDFTNGKVIVNGTAIAQTVNVGSGYNFIKGTQDKAVNSGLAASSVTVAPQDAVILAKVAPIASQASFSLASSLTSPVPPNTSFSAQLKTRSDTDASNLFTAKITFPANLLQVQSISTTGSFVTSWVDTSFDNTAGTISIIGGVTQPGYKTSGTDVPMATINFKTTSGSGGTANINFDTSPNKSAIYRNSDNTNILNSTTPLTLTVNPAPSPTATPSPSPTASPTPSPTPNPSPSGNATPSPSPTPTRTPSPTPTATPTPSPTPLPVACSLTSGTWSNLSINPVSSGTSVNLLVNSTGSCSGKTVAFNISQDNGILPASGVTTNPLNGIFTGNTTTSTWLAEYQPDGPFGIFDPPEYFFTATLTTPGAGTNSVNSSSPELQVNNSTGPAPSTPPSGPGDGNRDGVVNLIDMSVLFSNFTKVSTQPDFPTPLDLNSDGIINSFDFTLEINLLKANGSI